MLHQFGATTERSKPKFKLDIGADISIAESKFLDTLIMLMFYALVALCFFGSAMAQITKSGACPPVQVQQHFDSLKFCGRWFQWAGSFEVNSFPTECEIFDYVPRSNHTIKLINTFNSVNTGKRQVLETEVTVPDHKESAKMLTKIPLSPIEGYNNLWVLGTDYKNFAVVYSCTTTCSLNLQYGWILTRKRIPDDFVVAKAYEVVKKNNLHSSHLLKTNQAGCSPNIALFPGVPLGPWANGLW